MDQSNKQTSKEKWLEEGYRQFAESGPNNLSIKKISETIGLSRASFYHYFGDTDIFIEELLCRHWDIVVEFNKKGKSDCRHLFPDLYRLLASHPVPIQFSIQLFHHRRIPQFNYLFNKTYEASAEEFVLKLFVEEYSLEGPESELSRLWLTVGETWYARLDPSDLSAETLQHHAQEILGVVIKFANSRLYSTMKSAGD